MIKNFKFLVITTIFIITSIFCYTKLVHSKSIFIENNKFPSAQDIIRLLKDQNKEKQHPRLLAKSKDFTRIKKQISKDKLVAEKYNFIKSKSDIILKESPVQYELPDNVRLLTVSRKALERIQILAFVYKISGNQKYAERATLELLTISNDNIFPDWHPEHFLDTAEMTAAAAIGYDWLYDYLTSDQKSIIRNALLTKGLKQSLSFYSKQEGWVISDNNWNVVCNGGIGLGALAIADEGAEFELVSGKILENSIKSIPKMLTHFNPDGGWYEGLSYWDYSLTYIAYFISSLDSTVGTDFGLSQSPGLSSAGDFPIYITGPNGAFNFADSSAVKLKSSVMLWLANKFNKGEYAWYYNKLSTVKDSNVMSLIWYNNSIKDTKSKINDKFFRNIELVTMHSSLLDSKDSFVGFKAGNNNLSHSDLDIGTFVYDSLGERWFHDLGAEDYNVPGYWNMGANGTRWNYYKKRTEGHNTLVINPKTNINQNVYAKTKIISFKSNEKEAFAVADISDAYKDTAVSVKRGIALLKAYNSMIVQDEITTNKPTDIWWFAHTDAAITINDDKKSVILSKNGKYIYVSILSPTNANFSKMKAEPLMHSTNLVPQSNNISQKLSINLNNSGDTIISVLISPYEKTESSISVKELKYWK